MDNLTHTLTGLMMARAGLDRTTKRGGALMLMLAANVPDIDVVAGGFPGSLSYFQYHRGYTHSLALAPVMALIPLLLARWWGGATISWRTYFACLLGVLSHLAMDWTNAYGIRLLLPFSPRWLRLDLTSIVDPWILAILFIAMAAPALGGLVGSEIRGRKTAGATVAWAWLALVGVFGYEGFRFAAHRRAIAVMSARIYEGQPATRIAAIPETLNPLAWRGVIEAGDFVLNVPVVLNREFDPSAAEIDYPSPDSPAIEAARKTKVFQVFGNFNQLPFWKVTPSDNGQLVQLIDMRFGTPQEPGFGSATATVGPDGVARAAHLGFARPR